MFINVNITSVSVCKIYSSLVFILGKSISSFIFALDSPLSIIPSWKALGQVKFLVL